VTTQAKQLTILLDMDSIVVDFMPGLLDAYNKRYGRDVTIEQIITWDVGKCVPDGDLIYDVMREPGLFLNLKPVPGALAAIQRLSDEGHRICLVTSASGTAMAEKEAWVRQYIPLLFHRMIIARGLTPKSFVQGDVFIDDAPHNIINYRHSHPTALIMGICYPYTVSALNYANVLFDYRDPKEAWKQMVERIECFARQETV
jgi:5'(3')-deoxyribonucleotidase